jgi:hypothetical protein
MPEGLSAKFPQHWLAKAIKTEKLFDQPRENHV